MIARRAFALLNRLFPQEEASAHCDIPCGIYDPHLAQLAALSVVRMNQLINDLQPPAMGAGGPPLTLRPRTGPFSRPWLQVFKLLPRASRQPTPPTWSSKPLNRCGPWPNVSGA